LTEKIGQMFLYLMEGVRSMANATLRYQEYG